MRFVNDDSCLWSTLPSKSFRSPALLIYKEKQHREAHGGIEKQDKFTIFRPFRHFDQKFLSCGRIFKFQNMLREREKIERLVLSCCFSRRERAIFSYLFDFP